MSLETYEAQQERRALGARVHPHHMQATWSEVVSQGDELAVNAPLPDKSTIICRTGQLMLTWFVRTVLIVAFLPVGLDIARTLTDPRWRYTS